MAQKRENEELSSTSSDEDYPELPETKRPKSTGLLQNKTYFYVLIGVLQEQRNNQMFVGTYIN